MQEKIKNAPKITAKAYALRHKELTPKGKDCFDVVHVPMPGASPEKAKAEYIRLSEGTLSYREDIAALTAHRHKPKDLVTPPKHPLLAKLSKGQLAKLQHALGLNYKPRCYRNYFAVRHSNTDLDAMVDLKLMEVALPTRLTRMHLYHATKLGIAVAISSKPIYRLDYEKLIKGEVYEF